MEAKIAAWARRMLARLAMLGAALVAVCLLAWMAYDNHDAEAEQATHDSVTQLGANNHE